MATTNPSDALVIGAGFAGIAAATQLAELGHQLICSNGTTTRVVARVFSKPKGSRLTWGRVGTGCPTSRAYFRLGDVKRS